MKNIFAACCCFALASAPAHAINEAIQADAAQGYVSTHIIVKVRAGLNLRPGVIADGRPTLGNAAADAPLRSWNATGIRRAYEFEDNSRFGFDRYYFIDVPAGTKTKAMAADFKNRAAIYELAEVDGIGTVADDGRREFPSDQYFKKAQWSLRNTAQRLPSSGEGVKDADIDMPEAWGVTRGGQNIIAILDTGVNPHPDLPSSRFVPGWNSIYNNGTNTNDDCDHGTHVAGIAAASANNGIGIAGVNPGALIMPIRVLNACFGSQAQLAVGLLWAVANGAKIANMSLQYYGAPVTMLSEALQHGEEKGILSLAATGNGNGEIAYPAKYDYCMAIGATDNKDKRAGFSNFGPEIDLVAPGQEVWSLGASGAYRWNTGTSMASPHAAGVASLVLSYYPSRSPADLKAALRLATDRVPEMNGAAFTDWHGSGRLNAQKVFWGICLGDFNMNGRTGPTRDPQDPYAYHEAWVRGDLRADYDRNGSITAYDYTLFLEAFIAGCP